ncbi:MULTISPECIES: ligase-associated DNA damage response DEXH box helicase [unclassified Novosphingobium]|uniref:ligase-associated DNA damage response DEXH box helicase n=1 Tax=unclassified Novosphingobium TaxID=2644732 RepID=UPI000ECE49CD|nr:MULTISPECIES: ligase-associated DNA damage response DEXH box helicase [unclassified Novosphingobium]HCF25277.1 ligase-associated DNA damage response DEXH box helicase [Novosphingobium sp.]HQV02545.1 ligase-associated DNA damage response DEXH box helicase [Novosphingobium sp.]
MSDLFPPELEQWFSARGWRLRRHQAEMLAVAAAGRHALLVADTGAGKTLGGFLPTLADFCPSRLGGSKPEEGLHTLYVSPLKALAHDVQRNLLTPVAELGLDMRVEVRSGDTPSDRKARQRVRPPQVLLTTPESLSLLLSYPEAETMFAGLKRVVIDEIHAFAPTKRGDLLALALSRLQAIAPGLQRVGLSATLADPAAFAAWLAPHGAAADVSIVEGEQGAQPELSILLPEEARVPWGGHAAAWAVPQLYRAIKANRTTLVFCNTRFLAEFIFQQLWTANEDVLSIGIHHGSLSKEARRKVEGAMARGELRALVCTASLDLGVDWGDIDLVVQMGAPKGSSRLLQRIGRANHRLDQASRAMLVPGNRFEFLEAMAAEQAVAEGQRDGEAFRPGALDVLAQHVMARACAGPFRADDLLAEVQSAEPYRWLDAAAFDRVLGFVATGGYALRAYDRFQRITAGRDGLWRLTHPQHAARHRLNAGIIVDSEMVDVRFRNGRSLGRVEESFAAALRSGDTIRFAGLDLEIEAMRDTELIVRAAKKAGQIPSYMGQRLPLTTHLAGRVQALLDDRAGWSRFPDDVREWLEMQDWRSELPAPGKLLVESFPHEGKHFTVFYCFEGWPAHQSLGMLITRRMEQLGLSPMGFVANDYALAAWSLKAVGDPAGLLSPDILAEEFVAWVEDSYLLRRAFREVAVIAGLVERQHPGKRKTGRQVTFSTDLIYDVLRKHEPDHVLIEAAWADARARMTDIGRLAGVLDRAGREVRHVVLDRVSPLAVPVLVMIGRESLPQGMADDELLFEAESLAGRAMRGDPDGLDDRA